MCGGAMRVKERAIVVEVPGNPTGTSRLEREWVCPDCDYFEEVEQERS
jgi:hypothetical protein